MCNKYQPSKIGPFLYQRRFTYPCWGLCVWSIVLLLPPVYMIHASPWIYMCQGHCSLYTVNLENRNACVRGLIVFLKFGQFSSELTKTWSSGATEYGVWIGKNLAFTKILRKFRKTRISQGHCSLYTVPPENKDTHCIRFICSFIKQEP